MTQSPYRDDDDAAQRRADILGAWMSAAPSPAVVQAGEDSSTSSQQQLMREREDRARKYRPTVAKKIAAWLSAGLGLFCVIGVAMPPVDGTPFPQHAAMGISLAVFFGLPGAYWLVCNRRDQKKIAQWIRADASYREQLAIMSEADRSLLAQPDEWPSIPQRHWPVVWALVIIAVVVFSLVAPDTATVA